MESRAIEKKEKEAKTKVVAEPAYVTINLTPKKNEPAVRPPRNIIVGAPEAATDHSSDEESDEENYEDQGFLLIMRIVSLMVMERLRSLFPQLNRSFLMLLYSLWFQVRKWYLLLEGLSVLFMLLLSKFLEWLKL